MAAMPVTLPKLEPKSEYGEIVITQQFDRGQICIPVALIKLTSPSDPKSWERFVAQNTRSHSPDWRSLVTIFAATDDSAVLPREGCLQSPAQLPERYSDAGNHVLEVQHV